MRGIWVLLMPTGLRMDSHRDGRSLPTVTGQLSLRRKTTYLFPSGILPQTPTHTVHPFSKLETVEASLTTPLMSEYSMNKISHSLDTAAS